MRAAKSRFVRFYALVVFLTLLNTMVLGNEKLFVFYPSVVIRPKVLQEQLKSNLKNVDVTVFERFCDFESSMQHSPPDAIIAKDEVISQYPGYSIVLRGKRNGVLQEQYVLFSLGKEVSASDLKAGSVVGLVNFAGRTQTEKYAKDNLKSDLIFRFVVRPEDLIFLLIEKSAACVVIEKTFANYFRTSYSLEFYESPVTVKPSGIISCAAKGGGSIVALRKNLLQSSFNLAATVFGVESWK